MSARLVCIVPLAVVLASCAPGVAEQVRKRMACGEKAEDLAAVGLVAGRYWAGIGFLGEGVDGVDGFMVAPLDAWTLDPAAPSLAAVDLISALRAAKVRMTLPEPLVTA